MRALALLALVLVVPTSAGAIPDWTIRPGAWMTEPSLCTLGFLFHDEATDRYAVTTAGHCARVGQAVRVRTPDLKSARIGTTIVSVAGGPGNDLALVLIDPSMETRLEPAVALVGGPCGEATPTVGAPIVHVGHPGGAGLGFAPIARPGVATTTEGALVWSGAAYHGDSGGPALLATGEAVGLATHIERWNGVPTGVVKGTSLARIHDLAPEWSLVHAADC